MTKRQRRRRFEIGDTCPVCKDQDLSEEWLEYPTEGWYLVCSCPGCPFMVPTDRSGRALVLEELIRRWREQL